MGDKTKLLVLADDIRSVSGMSVQAKKLMAGLQQTGRYDIVHLGCSLIKQDPAPVRWGGVKVYPTYLYSNPADLRRVLAADRPDALLAFTDPRHLAWLFHMDREVRSQTKFLYYSTYDNEPFPTWNVPAYRAPDRTVFLSRFSHGLMSGNGVRCDLITHGLDPEEFYPLPPEVVASARARMLGKAADKVDFILFWHNRHMERKRVGDVICAFREFNRSHPSSCLVLSSTAKDPGSANIADLIDVQRDPPILINRRVLTSPELNVLYNIADASINISYWEGFGLSVAESLLAGTPVIATATGGMTEQLTTADGRAGVLIKPAVRQLYDSRDTPGGIYKDLVSQDQVVAAMDRVYRKGPAGREAMGLLGREHIAARYNIKDTVAAWDALIQEETVKPKLDKLWETTVC